MQRRDESPLLPRGGLLSSRDESPDYPSISESELSHEKWLQFGKWNWTPDTDVMDWSVGMYSVMNIEPEMDGPRMTMDLFMRYIIEEDRDRVKIAMDSAIGKEEKKFECIYSVIAGDRTEKVLQSLAKITYNPAGKVQIVEGFTRDITIPTHLQEELDKYRHMVMEREDFLGHGSWEWDLEGGNTVWSDGMYQLFGYDASNETEVPDSNNLYKRHLSTEAVDQADKYLREILESGSSDYAWSNEIKDRNGEVKIVESLGKIIRNRKGKGVKILGTTRDVTQLRKYELDLQQKRAELDRLSKELEDSAYAASHDLQEPLRKISTLSDRLQNKFNEVLPEDGRKYIERIQIASKNARLLIDSLLEFSRITHETNVFKVTDLNILLYEVKADLELKIEETHTVIRSGTLPTLQVSGLQLKQVFSNIILNSIKFRRPDITPILEIDSRILTPAEIRHYQLDTPLPHFLISIRDNGIGFDGAYSTKIFQMFSRLNGKSEYPGAGIGLALCKKIIENHRGLMFATGIPDEGAVFSFILPEKHD